MQTNRNWKKQEEIARDTNTVKELPDTAEMSSPSGRSRTCSESSEGEVSLSGVRTRPGGAGVSYDVDGKFSYSQVCPRIVLSCSVRHRLFVVGHAVPAAGTVEDDCGRKWEVFLLFC